MNKSYFSYQKKHSSQCCNNNDKLDLCNDKSDKQINNCSENKKDCKSNNCYDNKKNCFCYQYLLGATGPTGPTGPQGLIGATGPTDPSLGLSVFGGRFNNATQTITLEIGTQAQIPLANTMSSRGVTYTTANSINIPSATISRALSVELDPFIAEVL